LRFFVFVCYFYCNTLLNNLFCLSLLSNNNTMTT
jgi:hypothetical protein